MDKLSSRGRLLLFIIIDSFIVAFSVFICYNILEPYFRGYSHQVLMLTSIILLISHHVFAYIFNLYHRAWEYASVNELLLIVESVTCSILVTIIKSSPDSCVKCYTMFLPFLLIKIDVFS